MTSRRRPAARPARPRGIVPAFLFSGNPSPRTEAPLSWIVANIHRIMIVSGLLPMTMIYAAIAPEAALRSTFGDSVSGPVADIVVRNWGALIALVGAMLSMGRANPRHVLWP